MTTSELFVRLILEHNTTEKHIDILSVSEIYLTTIYIHIQYDSEKQELYKVQT